jgi:hypothetical protein
VSRMDSKCHALLQNVSDSNEATKKHETAMASSSTPGESS